MMNIFKIVLLVLSFAFSSTSFAITFCETYTHVQMKDKYTANFLKKDMQGCFSYSINPQERTSHGGHISIRLGNQLTNLPQATIAKIAFETFTSFVNSEKSNKAISRNVDENINNIRSGTASSIAKVRNDLANFKEVYNLDAIPQIKENHIELKKNASKISNTVDVLNQKSSALFAKKEERKFPGLPGTNIQTTQDPIEKEKQKWARFNEINTIPFRSLEKINKAQNEILTKQLLKEIKTARFNKLGLAKIEKLPLLEQVQKYEKKENVYNQKLDFINKSPELTTSYSNEQIDTIKTIAHEFKKESEKNLINGELKTANDSIDMAYLALDIATSLPILASGRGLYELYTGKSLIDGHELTKSEIGIAGGMILLDLTPVSVITRGAGLITTLGKTGTRLAERGIIKAGFEEGLSLSVNHAEAFKAAANNLISQGLVKYDTLKKVIDYNLFFKFIDKETYFATKNYAEKILRFESVSATLAKEGIEATPNLNQYISNLIQYDEKFIADEIILENSRMYLDYESKFNSLKPSNIDDLIVNRGVSRKYTEHPFETNKEWFFSNMATSHRYSMKGEPALYTVIGSSDNSINAALAEIEASSSMAHTIALESKTFSSKKVLDLTDPKTLEALGISEDQLLDTYTLPQILSHLAKMNQYDSIIATGAKKYIHGTNIKLEYYKNYVILRGF